MLPPGCRLPGGACAERRMNRGKRQRRECSSEPTYWLAIPSDPNAMATSVESLNLASRASSRRKAPIARSVVSGLTALADALLVIVPGFVIFALHVAPEHPQELAKYAVVLLIYTLLLAQSLQVAGLYELQRIMRPQAALPRLLLISLAIFLGLLLCAFGLKISDNFSRIWALSWIGSTVVLLTAFRFGLAHLLRHSALSGAVTRNLIVYGADRHGEQLVQYLRKLDEPWNRLVGVFDDRKDRVPSECSGYRVLGDIDSLVKFAQACPSDEVLLALPSASHQRILEIVDRLSPLPANVRLAPNLFDADVLGFPVSREFGVPMLDVLKKPVSGWGVAGKWLLDFGIGSLLLLCALPLLLLIALAIKLDSRGPVFFRQPRYGFNNQIIEVLKFRTMYTDQSDFDAAQLTTRNDPRVTRVGGFLRRFSLDELPQLINVVKGEMSIVGPRPHALQAKAGGKLYADVIDAYAVRSKVKPGLTGWAQVNGWRGNTETEDDLKGRVEHDLYYIENWSVGFDLWILVRTVFAVLKATNSY
jgi:Undecaprenyl-phosphate glucose phosphotransferase